MNRLKKINVSEVLGNEYSIFSPGTLWVDRDNKLRISDGVTEGGILIIDPESNSSPPLANGNSKFDIATSNGNATITVNGVSTWTFDTNGDVTFPDSTIQTTAYTGTALKIANGNSNIDIATIDSDVTITTNNNIWTFNTAGNLNLPGGGIVDGSDFDVDIIAGNDGANSVFGHVSFETNGPIGLNSLTFNSLGEITVSTADANDGLIKWVANSSGDGFGFTTMVLVPDTTVEGYDQYLIIDPTGPDHIHIRAGGTQDNSIAQLYLGGENSHFLVDSGENPPVYVTSNNNTWTFDAVGNLNLPGNVTNFAACSAINFVANSSGDGSGYSTIELRPDSNAGSDQYIIIDPTTGGHIHVRAGGTQDSSSGELFLGGENSHVRIGAGPNPPVTISANAYSWNFDNNNRNLYVPGPINFQQNATIPLGAPTANGANDRITIWDFQGAGSGYNYAIGAEGNHIWFTMDVNNGTGGFKFYSRDNQIFKIRDNGVLENNVLTYSALPSATTAGLRAFINDANTVALGNFGVVISGGGANNVPVFSDGTDWRIG